MNLSWQQHILPSRNAGMRGNCASSSMIAPLFRLSDCFSGLCGASMGPNLRKLTINATTWKKFPLLLDSTLTTPVTRFEELSVTLCPSSSINLPINPTPGAVGAAFVAFANSQRHSLQLLTISSFEKIDLSAIFISLGHFPVLKELRLLVFMDRRHLSKSSTLTGFLRSHKDTLETLVVPRSHTFTPIREPTPAFVTWLKEFSTLEFPSLQTLKIGLLPASPLTSMIPLVPRLTSLYLSDTVLNHEDVANIIKNLDRSSTNQQLKRLYLVVAHFSWELLDLLSSKLPELEMLSVRISILSSPLVVSFSSVLYHLPI